MESIGKYLSEDSIVFLKTKTKERALNSLVQALEKSGKLNNSKKFSKAILEREKIVSTGIGNGVALPHAKQKLNEQNDFCIAIGIQRDGIDWKSIDKEPVKIIFMIGGPENKQTEYLQLLSSITSIINNANIRNNILKLDTKEEVYRFFESPF